MSGWSVRSSSYLRQEMWMGDVHGPRQFVGYVGEPIEASSPRNAPQAAVAAEPAPRPSGGWERVAQSARALLQANLFKVAQETVNEPLLQTVLDRAYAEAAANRLKDPEKVASAKELLQQYDAYIKRIEALKGFIMQGGAEACNAQLPALIPLKTQIAALVDQIWPDKMEVADHQAIKKRAEEQFMADQKAYTEKFFARITVEAREPVDSRASVGDERKAPPVQRSAQPISAVRQGAGASQPAASLSDRVSRLSVSPSGLDVSGSPSAPASQKPQLPAERSPLDKPD